MTRSKLDGFDYAYDGINFPRTTFTDVDRGIGAISITGLSAWGGSTTNPKFHDFGNFQISDSVSWLLGDHNVRFGGHMEYQMYDLTSDFTTMGSYSFASINNFLLVDRARFFDAVQPGSDTSRRLRQSVFGFFVQDDWRLRSDVTLNAGLRYEPTGDITEVDGKLSQLIDFWEPTATLNDAEVVEAIVVNPSKGNFAPRIGMAWDIGGKGKTVLRGGAGVFYDLITANTNFVQNTAVRVPPFFNRSRITGSNSVRVDFPNAYFTQAALLAGQAQLEGIQYEPDQPTVVKWNVNVQRELWARTSIEVGYTGSVAGRATVSAAFYYNRTQNEILFTQSGVYTPSNPPPGWPARLIPALAVIRPPSEFTYLNFGKTTYQGIELGVISPVNRYVDFYANYSWQSEPDPEGFDLSELNLPPSHRFNAGVGFDLPRFQGNFSVGYTGDAFWQDVLNDPYHGTTKPYTLVNAGVGYQWLDDKVTTSLKFVNLANSTIQQHVFGDISKFQMVAEVKVNFPTK